MSVGTGGSPWGRVTPTRRAPARRRTAGRPGGVTEHALARSSASTVSSKKGRRSLPSAAWRPIISASPLPPAVARSRGRSSRAPPSRDPTRHPSWRGALAVPCGTCAMQTLAEEVRLEVVEDIQKMPSSTASSSSPSSAGAIELRSHLIGHLGNCPTTHRPTQVAPRVTQLDEPRAEARRQPRE